MTRQYRDPKTGFLITTNDDSWQVGYQPPPPEPAPTPEPTWGDIGQGFRGSAGLDMSRISDARYYAEHKKEIEERLYYEAGIEPHPRKNY